MKTTRIALTALALLAALAPSAVCEQVWNEQRITNTLWEEGAPLVWGDQVYYADRRNGYGEIYVWDEAHGPRKLLGGDGVSRTLNAVYGDRLVTNHYVNGQRDIYIYDPVNGERPISTAPGSQYDASIYGDTVVYEDWQSGIPQVHIWDPVNGDRPLCPSNTWQQDPKIWGNRIVWNDSQFGTYMWTPEEGAVWLGSGVQPAVYQDRVVNWTLAHDEWNGNGYTAIPGYLWEWTPTTGWSRLAQHMMADPSGIIGTQVWGDLVVWQARVTLPVVQAWDPVHGFSVVDQSTYGWEPSVYGNKVAWAGEGAEGRTDIYLCTMVPEPSSLLALAGGFGFLLMRGRRKRSS